MNKFILICILLLCRFTTYGQDSLQASTPGEMFRGGDDALNLFLLSNIKYPNEAKKNCITGKIYVQFDIDSLGKVDNAKVVAGGDPMLEKEALRVVKISNGKWKSSTLEKTTCTLSFVFHLQNNGCKDRDYYYNLGIAFYKLDNFEKAIEYFDMALSFDYMDTDALLRGGISYFKLNDIKNGCILLNRLKSSGKKNADALLEQYCK